MTIEINGMAHVILTVSRFDVARDFYRKLLPQFGMRPVFDGDKFFPDYGLSSAIKIEYEPRTFDCFCGFERWQGTKSSFKKASVRRSLPLFTEQRISAARR